MLPARAKRVLATVIFKLLAALVAYITRRLARVQISLSKLLVARPKDGAAHFNSSLSGTLPCVFVCVQKLMGGPDCSGLSWWIPVEGRSICMAMTELSISTNELPELVLYYTSEISIAMCTTMQLLIVESYFVYL